jgi:3-dehydroquinate synthase
MVIISRIAAARGWCDASIPLDIAAALALNGLPCENPYPAEELLPFMLSDKKRAGDTITLVVPETLGRCVRREVPVAALPQLMNLKG